MSEEFKVGDRVEWCFSGMFEKFSKSADTSVHEFGNVLEVPDTSNGMLVNFDITADCIVSADSCRKVKCNEQQNPSNKNKLLNKVSKLQKRIDKIMNEVKDMQ